MSQWASGPGSYTPRTRAGYYKSTQFTGRRAGWMARRPSSRFAAFGGARGAGPRRLFRPQSVNRALQKNSGELKGMDTTLTIAGPIIATTNTNADSFVLNLIEPGNGSFNRIGRKTFAKSLRISGHMVYIYNADPTTGDTTGVPVRMVVVWDKQPSGTLPTFDVIFGRTSQDGTEATSVLDNLRYDNMGRFQVLRDCKFEPKPMVGDGGGSANLCVNPFLVDEFIDLKNRETVFSGDSDPITIADISSGGLYVYFRATGSTNQVIDWAVSGTMSSRLRFTS